MARVLGAVGGSLTAIPILLILIVLLRPLRGLAIYGGTDSLWFGLFILLVALAGAPRMAEGIRRRVVVAAGSPHLEGAVAVGASRGWILRRHVLPSLLPEMVVMTAEGLRRKWQGDPQQAP